MIEVAKKRCRLPALVVEGSSDYMLVAKEWIPRQVLGKQTVLAEMGKTG